VKAIIPVIPGVTITVTVDEVQAKATPFRVLLPGGLAPAPEKAETPYPGWEPVEVTGRLYKLTPPPVLGHPARTMDRRAVEEVGDLALKLGEAEVLRDAALRSATTLKDTLAAVTRDGRKARDEAREEAGKLKRRLAQTELSLGEADQLREETEEALAEMIRQRKEAVDKLEGELADARRMEESLKAELEGAREEATEAHRAAATFNRLRTEAERAHISATEERDKLRGDVERLRPRVWELEKELEKEVAEKEAAASRSAQEWEDEVILLETQRDSLKGALEDLKGQRDAARKELEALAVENRTLRAAAAKAGVEAEEWEEALDEARRERDSALDVGGRMVGLVNRVQEVLHEVGALTDPPTNASLGFPGVVVTPASHWIQVVSRFRKLAAGALREIGDFKVTHDNHPTFVLPASLQALKEEVAKLQAAQDPDALEALAAENRTLRAAAAKAGVEADGLRIAVKREKEDGEKLAASLRHSVDLRLTDLEVVRRKGWALEAKLRDTIRHLRRAERSLGAVPIPAPGNREGRAAALEGVVDALRNEVGDAVKAAS
jgi:hypothetical protein